MNYDFSQLNDKEFEILAADVLSAYLRVRIERFKPGRDGGVDGRFFSDVDGEIVLQCKHYLKTGYRGMLNKIIRDELEKINKLNPSKYIFITSLPLSRDNKKELRNALTPHIKRDEDIYGQEDLNDLLARFPSIEEKHFKLWISSAAVFNRMLNNAIKGRSEYELEQLRRKSHKYVQTETYTQALDILKNSHILIISGEPGIGKTTLAENICLYFASKGYEFIDIEESLTEAENLYSQGKKQVFYFDDFLGSNYLEAISNKKDSHIIKFIERITDDDTKLFVLTSRTNILNSGVYHSGVFTNKALRKDEFLLAIDSLTQMDRAKILYNHIWFSELTDDYIDKIYKGKRYVSIINHQNYNPRLVEFITDVNRITAVGSANYWEHISETLNNPKDIWANCFKVQNNAFVRNLVSLIVFNGGHIDEEELQRGFYKLCTLGVLGDLTNTEKDFSSIAQLATKSFLKRSRWSDKIYYHLFNPSISDYILAEYCGNIEKLTIVYSSLGTVRSLKELVSLSKGNVISDVIYTRLTQSIFNYALNENMTYDYLILISDLICKDEKNKENIIRIIGMIIHDPAPISELSKFLALCTKFHDSISIGKYDFLFVAIKDRYLDEIEVSDLGIYINKFGVENKDVMYELKSSLEHYIIDELSPYRSGLDLSKYVDIQFSNDGYEGVSFDGPAIELELSDIAVDAMRSFDLNVFRELNIQIEDIISEVDIDGMVDEYIEAKNEPDYDHHRDQPIEIRQDIDDLFERL